MQEPQWISERLAFAIHESQIAEHGGESGIRDENLLRSALAKSRNVFCYGAGAADYALCAAAYLTGVVQNHPFIDGNKRTGLVLCGTFIRLNGMRIVAPLSELYSLTMSVATGNVDEEEITDWIRGHLQSAS
jgi:death on curing protein